jgi:hypothetical protein
VPFYRTKKEKLKAIKHKACISWGLSRIFNMKEEDGTSGVGRCKIQPGKKKKKEKKERNNCSGSSRYAIYEVKGKRDERRTKEHLYLFGFSCSQ